jgi:hypothetical protein
MMAAPTRHRNPAVVIAAWALLIAGSFLLFESGAVLYHYVVKNEFLWVRATPSTPAAPVPGPIGSSGLTLSPYFGYVNERSSGPTTTPAKPIGVGAEAEPASAHDCAKAPDINACRSFLDAHGIDWSPRLDPEWRINNHGFQSPYDYPVAIDPGAFVIGIFGGSVAFQYAFWASDRRSQVLKGLEQELGRPVVVLNFGIGGGKQPQQALQLAYFVGAGQRFDLILNLDGLNELYVGWLNANRDKIDPSMPAARILRTIGNNYSERLLAGNDDRRTRLTQSLRGWSERSQRTRLATVHYAADAMRQHYANRLVALEEELSLSTSTFPLLLTRKPDGGEAFADSVSENWSRNSITMAAVAASIDAHYIHVLQPNQYFSSKHFTDLEIAQRNVLGEGDAPLREIVPRGYLAYLKRADTLKKKGISFVSAVRLFDRVKEDIYYDWCCHFNERGHRLLDLLIQRTILLAIDPARHGSRIGQLDASIYANAKMEIAELLETTVNPPRDAGADNRRRMAAALLWLDEAERKGKAAADSLADYNEALKFLGSLYALDPKNKEVLNAHLRAYRARAALLGRTGAHQAQIGDLRSVIAVLGQLAALEPGDKAIAAAIDDADREIGLLKRKLTDRSPARSPKAH